MSDINDPQIEPSDAHDPVEERIRQRAYHFWEEAGRPDGQDAEFWHRAREAEATPSEMAGETTAEVIAGQPAEPPLAATRSVAPPAANRARASAR